MRTWVGPGLHGPWLLVLRVGIISELGQHRGAMAQHCGVWESCTTRMKWLINLSVPMLTELEKIVQDLGIRFTYIEPENSPDIAQAFCLREICLQELRAALCKGEGGYVTRPLDPWSIWSGVGCHQSSRDQNIQPVIEGKPVKWSMTQDCKTVWLFNERTLEIWEWGLRMCVLWSPDLSSSVTGSWGLRIGFPKWFPGFFLKCSPISALSNASLVCTEFVIELSWVGDLSGESQVKCIEQKGYPIVAETKGHRWAPCSRGMFPQFPRPGV